MSTDSPIVWHWTRSRASRRLRWLARVVAKPLMTYWPMTDLGISALGSLNRWMGDRLPEPERAEIERIILGGVHGEVTRPRQPATDELAGGAILYLHGGAFLFGGPPTHRDICAQLAASTGLPVHSMDYRQLPDGPVADSVADAMAAYTALSDSVRDPTRIIVAGDSAGGYLSMKVGEIAALRGIQPPAAVIGFSPLLNIELSAADDPGYFARDAYLPIGQLERLRGRWLGGPDSIEGADSPLDADPALFPPVFLSAADYELLRPGVEKMTRLLHASGAVVETHLWAGQVHAFPAVGEALPEGREIVRLCSDFARRAVRLGQRRDAGSERPAGEQAGRGPAQRTA